MHTRKIEVNYMEELLKKMMAKLESMDSRFDAIDSRLDAMDTKIDRIEHKLDAHHLENIESDNRLLEMIHTLRCETNVNFKKLDRRVKLIETDLDHTMIQVEECLTPKN
ncbi:hypothetical protein [Paenibacillus roseipurpureus]|uniref:t-SNARE coiled-coil homology domain-containing protein n=1 Tax=Paenibacillus roseopurpureus TaxID=2918901 RepID=A0AA96LMI8_9BACL|nr:hypothetical protein [Paenibacillus sp. MBLB1832]WNR43891.1 hypothetical protein MJB10_22785 [Paenibacillus sp. MBLB1832]